jgi:hypothetical protein
VQAGAAIAFAHPPNGGGVSLDLLPEGHDPLLIFGAAQQDLRPPSDPQGSLPVSQEFAQQSLIL